MPVGWRHACAQVEIEAHGRPPEEGKPALTFPCTHIVADLRRLGAPGNFYEQAASRTMPTRRRKGTVLLAEFRMHETVPQVAAPP